MVVGVVVLVVESVVDVVLVLALVLVGVDTLGPELLPHAASTKPPNAANASARALLEGRAVFIARQPKRRGWGASQA
ncbi:MAG TPA: hypothetical protein VLV81_03660 [Acidimicrobiia bacterium]|nr:hypothetical protein [Acidimicrobiia bacterium]